VKIPSDHITVLHVLNFSASRPAAEFPSWRSHVEQHKCRVLVGASRWKRGSSSRFLQGISGIRIVFKFTCLPSLEHTFCQDLVCMQSIVMQRTLRVSFQHGNIINIEFDALHVTVSIRVVGQWANNQSFNFTVGQDYICQLAKTLRSLANYTVYIVDKDCQCVCGRNHWSRLLWQSR